MNEQVEPKIIVSGCLLGQKVRYDGGDCFVQHDKLQALYKQGLVLGVVEKRNYRLK